MRMQQAVRIPRACASAVCAPLRRRRGLEGPPGGTHDLMRAVLHITARVLTPERVYHLFAVLAAARRQREQLDEGACAPPPPGVVHDGYRARARCSVSVARLSCTACS